MGQSPDPDNPKLGLRWILPHKRDILCTCTEIGLGGINFGYYSGEDQMSLINNDNIDDMKQKIGCLNDGATGKNL